MKYPKLLKNDIRSKYDIPDKKVSFSENIDDLDTILPNSDILEAKIVQPILKILPPPLNCITEYEREKFYDYVKSFEDQQLVEPLLTFGVSKLLKSSNPITMAISLKLQYFIMNKIPICKEKSIQKNNIQNRNRI